MEWSYECKIGFIYCILLEVKDYKIYICKVLAL